jgi:2-dehydro-3-deoxygluconokinase
MKVVVAFGEVLLRLKAPGFERLLQSPQLQVYVGGAELNVLASLARFGHGTRLVSTLADNPLGDAALAEIRAYGIDASAVDRRPGRMGLYFAESGHGHRPGQVLYDRAASAFAIDRSARPWSTLLADAALLHLTGITATLSSHAASSALAGAVEARAMGKKVSVDVNYRAQLWAAAEQSREIALVPLLHQAHILFASSADLASALGLEQAAAQGSHVERFAALAALALDALPGLEIVCTCLRLGDLADRNELVAIGRDRSGTYASAPRTLEAIVDRIGAGDAFAAAVLHAVLSARPLGQALEFGLAAASLKHSVAGDVNRVSEAEVSAHVAGMSGALLRR